MALTNAEKSARWRARHPDRQQAYLKSPRRRELTRLATRRWRARHPKEHKPLPEPVSLDYIEADRRAALTRRWKAKLEGFVDCIEYPPPPSDSKCQNCGALARLHLDHNHETGAFRGWLCLQCNMGIGQLGDDIAGLERALAYLKREGASDGVANYNFNDKAVRP